jgi:chromosome partitioning protein
MFKICVAHQKGGTGKSLLTKSMAMESPDTSVVTDTDPQGTTRQWIEKRRGRGVTNPAAAFCTPKQLDQAIKQAESAKTYDYFFVDTPPDHQDETSIRLAIKACDALVIPTGMSTDDLNELPKIVKLANAQKKPWCIVLNRGKRSRALVRADDICKRIAEQYSGFYSPTIIYDRMEHVDGAMTNMVAREVRKNSKAADEITAMTAFVKETLQAEVEKRGNENE